jgi:hypothetical protein
MSLRHPDMSVYSISGARMLRFIAPLVEEPLTIQLKDASVVREHCARFGRRLDGIIAELRLDGQRRVAAERAGDLLNMIADAGLTFLAYVLDDPHGDFEKLTTFLLRACPTWRNRRAPTPLMHVVVDSDDYFPWEMLPLFGVADHCATPDQLALEQSALRFVGFASVVERRYPYHSTDGEFLESWERLPVRLVYDATYSGAKDELGFFRAMGHGFWLKGPYPLDISDTSAPTLAQQLNDPRLGVDGTADAVADQVVHFACHCEAARHDPSTMAYRLADEKERVKVIRLDDLLRDLMLLARKNSDRQRWQRDRPLVFLNACGTAAMDPASAASLLKPFHDNRNRGIIGTAANVPDRSAAHVSKSFYTCLLTQPISVGAAIHEAKWRLLQERGNPLGLLYSLHACAGLRVAPIRDNVTAYRQEQPDEGSH